MSDIFSETNMITALEKYIPNGETLRAGIHAGANETSAAVVFTNCDFMHDRLIPFDKGKTIIVRKKKYSGYDVYIGITENFLVITNCEKYSYFYDISEIKNEDGVFKNDVTDDILLEDIGKVYAYTDIEKCEIKKAWLGSFKCNITMKNGDYFKLMFPKLGGLGGGMPRHAEYRAEIIERLNKLNT